MYKYSMSKSAIKQMKNIIIRTMVTGVGGIIIFYLLLLLASYFMEKHSNYLNYLTQIGICTAAFISFLTSIVSTYNIKKSKLLISILSVLPLLIAVLLSVLTTANFKLSYKIIMVPAIIILFSILGSLIRTNKVLHK